MKKGVLLVLAVLLVSILSLAGCGEPELETVTMAEHEAFKTEVTGRLDMAEEDIGDIQEAVKDLPAIRDDVSTIRGLLEAPKGQSDELVELKVRMAVNEVKVDEREKDVTELRQDVKDIPRSCQPPRPHRQTSQSSFSSIYIERTGNLWIDQTGYYEFRISPDDVEITVKGRKVVSHEIVKLPRGTHRIRSPEPVDISYRFVYY